AGLERVVEPERVVGRPAHHKRRRARRAVIVAVGGTTRRASMRPAGQGTLDLRPGPRPTMSSDVAERHGSGAAPALGSTQMDPTARIQFGKTSLTTTRLGLGSAPLGGLFDAVSDETAHGVVQHAYDSG